MKKIVMVLAFLLPFSWASIGAQPKDALNPLKSSPLQKQKRSIITQNMTFTEQESKAFWPLYDEYQEGLNRLSDRTAALIMDYTKEYDSLSDEKVKALQDEFLRLDEERLKLKKGHLEKFRRVLPEKKVMRYFQLENRLEAILNFEVANAIPLMK